MTDDTDIIAQGAAAWSRVRSRSTFDDWISIGRALVIGRGICMAQAGTNRPMGTTYNRLMGEWLKSVGLDGVTGQERYAAISVVENLPEIEKWRAELPDEDRRRMNHPGGIFNSWKASAGKGRAPKEMTRAWRQTVHHARPSGTLAALPTGDKIQWVADAMRETNSRDWLVLAKAAIVAVDRFRPAQVDHVAA